MQSFLTEFWGQDNFCWWRQNGQNVEQHWTGGGGLRYRKQQKSFLTAEPCRDKTVRLWCKMDFSNQGFIQKRLDLDPTPHFWDPLLFCNTTLAFCLLQDVTLSNHDVILTELAFFWFPPPPSMSRSDFERIFDSTRCWVGQLGYCQCVTCDMKKKPSIL